MYLLTVAALLVATAIVVIGVCQWPAISPRFRIGSGAVPPETRPESPKRSDFTLIA